MFMQKKKNLCKSSLLGAVAGSAPPTLAESMFATYPPTQMNWKK